MFKIGNVLIKSHILVAPMAGITDMPYREILKSFGAGLLTTELVSSRAICFDNKKTDKIIEISEYERPISLQLFGSDPDIMANAAVKTIDKYDILDINMGCPVLKVVRNGEGCALMKNVKLSCDIVKKIVKAVGDKKPVTCKIRIGFSNDNINAVEFAKHLEYAGASAITVHGRTRTQMYSGECNLDVIKEVVKNVKIPVIGNGGIFTVEDAKKMIDYTGCIAIALGRAVKGNPWFVRECVEYVENNKKISRPTIIEIKNMMLTLFKKEIIFRGEEQAMNEMKHHLSWFTIGISGASKFRVKINNAKSCNEIENLINDFFCDKE